MQHHSDWLDWAFRQDTPSATDYRGRPSVRAGRVHVVLLYLANHCGPDGLCWPARNAIADTLGWQRGAVGDALRALQEAALIVDTGQRKGSGRGATVWQLIVDEGPGSRSLDGRAKGQDSLPINPQPKDRPSRSSTKGQDTRSFPSNKGPAKGPAKGPSRPVPNRTEVLTYSATRPLRGGEPKGSLAPAPLERTRDPLADAPPPGDHRAPDTRQAFADLRAELAERTAARHRPDPLLDDDGQADA